MDKGTQLLLLPIWSGESCAHWTLLALEISGIQVRGIRYYDSLTQEHKGCRLTGEFHLQLLHRFWLGFWGEEMEFPKEVPKRWNTAMQEKGSNRCGLHVLHYLENYNAKRPTFL